MIKIEAIGKYLINYPNSGVEKVEKVQELVGNSGSCFIFRAQVILNGKIRTLVLKQAIDSLKIDPSFKLSPKRLAWETEALKYFSDLSSPSYFPEVLWYDAKNFVLVMEDIEGKDGLLLKKEIDKNNFHPEIAERFAEFLADIHLSSYKNPIVLSMPDDEGFSDYWLKFLQTEVIDKFYTAGARKVAVASIVDDLLDESRRAPQVTIWMDPLAKNIFIQKEGFKLIDFETTTIWDIAWDPALFISDWVIKSASRDQKLSRDAKYVVKTFLVHYINKVSEKIDKHEIEKIKNRIYRYIGIFLLHRTNGADCYKFDEETYHRIQEEGLRAVQNLYTSDFAKELVDILGVNELFGQEEFQLKSGNFMLRGILQLPRHSEKKEFSIAIYIHGGTDRGMLGSPAIYETTKILLANNIAVLRFNLTGTATSDGLLKDKTWTEFESCFKQVLRFVKTDGRFAKIGAFGRSYGATILAANADNIDLCTLVLQNPIFDEWYEFIHLLPEMTLDYIKNPKMKILPLGEKKHEYIKGHYEFNSKIIGEFPLEKWKMMQALPKARNVCTIQAENDPETTPQHALIIHNMTNEPKAFHIIKDTVHKFPGKEGEVAKITADWLVNFLK